MSLRDIPLKHCYDSDEDDILNDFYIPALENSLEYHRLAGFFSSTSLAIAARGIQGLVKNNGKMRLVTGIVLSKEDIEAIREGIENPEKVIEDMMIRDLDEIEDKFVKDHVQALAWLVANKKLEIKVAISLDESNLPLDREAAERTGIFHQKIGILKDNEGNIISFSGSENETMSSWQNNIEEFKVFRSWVEAERQYLEADLKKFNKFWNGVARRTKVIDIPIAIKEKLIKLAPKDFNELKLDIWAKRKRPIQLRDYQKTAIDEWFKNNKRGIFEMATGTGKTFTALGCLDRLLDEEKKLVTVIACPSNHLVNQWNEEISKFGFEIDRIIADSTNPNWREQLVDYLMDIKIGLKDKLIVLTTHDTFPKDDFTNIIKKTSTKLFLIVDEVHGIGAPIRRKGLIENYVFRLGLSATPKRWLDLEGTEYIFDYFGDVVFSFPLKKAIEKKFLVPYEYHPIFVELTTNELKEYVRGTARIAKAYQFSDDEKKKDYLKRLLIKRREIVKNAINKYHALKELLEKLDNPSHCIIYCSSRKQMKGVRRILQELNILDYHDFTMNEETKPLKELNGLSEREDILRKFAEGKYSILLAMKCLDEGVDIPQARIGVLMASSGNPREYIQRRGRLLRRYPGKDKAIIYDIVVGVPLDNIPPELLNIEKKIFYKELERYLEFAEIALNRIECLEIVRKVMDTYGEI